MNIANGRLEIRWVVYKDLPFQGTYRHSPMLLEEKALLRLR